MSKLFQRGVGLMEVLVALLLLAIGVLGYVALQVRAVEASTEATQRSQALFVLRGLAESIRANNAGRLSYQALVNAPQTSNSARACINTDSLCTANTLAQADVAQAQANANNFGMQLRMQVCPGVNNMAGEDRRMCLYAAWGATDISGNTNACMTAAGVYVVGSSCLMMELY